MSLLPLLVALAASVHANERRLAYTYDTLTLPAGAREIEPWTTVLLPTVEGAGITMKQRAELEWGVTDRLTTAFYLNWEATASGSSFEGISSEWKLNLLSRATHAVGVALYGEASIAPTENEVEVKLLLDKEAGPLLVAYNLVGELELERESEAGGAVDWERETVVANRLGLSYKPGAGAVGLEVLEDTELHEGEVEIALAAGPAVSWADDGWWAALSAPVTFAELAGGETEVDPSVQVRLLLGFDF